MFNHEEGSRRHRFVIYLPTKRKDGTPVAGFEQLAFCAEELICARLGGVTSYPAGGAFRRETGEIQREHVQVLETFCDQKLWKKEGGFLCGLATILARELDQESVACSLDGQMALATSADGTDKQLGDLGSCTPEGLKALVEAANISPGNGTAETQTR